MSIERILDYAHTLMGRSIQTGDVVIDGTCGNGHDTTFLANHVGKEGHVYAFDIQQEAILNTQRRLNTQGLDQQTTLIYDSHAHIQKYLQNDHHGNIAAAIYNLGYLPGSDKSIITKPEGTIQSVESVLATLKKGGLVVLVVYHGHPGGSEEKDALMSYVTELDAKNYQVLYYGFINKKKTPPFILAIERLK
ncbi:Putative rRNA methylase [Halobacillus karajensis]|uniref:Arsenite S-adenosylmethyltransferase n=1 Tax=Halobacillus karajensis TaxID=195088 RepID=A0A024PAS8_9BACI|nr:class I SAM-dependent methyltransferase [Halobacillus karajensis]CDQ21391.1 arsenite S-adenosylmethyltransferase [Halobacillus karajensis]CDQ25537.1 arsenite S-adenosylmethyltransferase [Halobacillus karajensis]CDQ25808.1 arsenite S-adenosylmethyltransferase [Halobacillus karajensis]SEI13875.1 Putative rRNA methylase [Halobacillus karajensis]